MYPLYRAFLLTQDQLVIFCMFIFISRQRQLCNFYFIVSCSILFSIYSPGLEFQVSALGQVPNSPLSVGLYNRSLYHCHCECQRSAYCSQKQRLYFTHLLIINYNHNAYTSTCNEMGILKQALNYTCIFNMRTEHCFQTYSWMAHGSWLVSHGFYCENLLTFSFLFFF